MGTHAQTRHEIKPTKQTHTRKATHPATTKSVKAHQQQSEDSIAAKL